MPKRVAVTGLGAISGLGSNVISNWKNLIKGDSAVDYLDMIHQVKVAARVKEPGNFIDYALKATEEAWLDSQCTLLEETGVSIGSGIGGIEDIVHTANLFGFTKDQQEKGYRKISPFFVPKLLANAASSAVSIRYGFKGPLFTPSSACTAGAHAISDGFKGIRYGDMKVCIVGGSESPICPIAMAGFARMKALASKWNHDPKRASRPFDKDRAGFVIGEGAGILVLEEWNHAEERGANIYAEIVGVGNSADAHHISAPPANGEGAYQCMKKALVQAKVSPNQVGYINAHATSTPLGDAAELNAIQRLFHHDIAVSSTKGATGHLLGASGAIESIFTILALKHEILPPTLNLEQTDWTLNLVPKVAQNKQLSYAMSNSFGFGGTNCSILFKSVV